MVKSPIFPQKFCLPNVALIFGLHSQVFAGRIFEGVREYLLQKDRVLCVFAKSII